MLINGLDVIDAKVPVTIEITRGDVKKGDKKDPFSCAAALSCKRQIKGVTAALVHIGRTYLKVNNHWVRYMTPHSLRTEIVAFDRGGTFAHGEYTLNPPCESSRLGYRKKDGRGSGPRKVERAKPHYVSNVRAHKHKGAVLARSK